MEFEFNTKWIKWGVLALIVIVLLFGTIGTVLAGYVGIKTRFGAVESTVQPGLYFKLPFVEGVVQMDVQTQKDEIDSASAASQDLQTVNTNIVVNYHLEPSDAAHVYASVGIDYANRVISPAIQEALKAVTAQYTAEQLITNRETVRAAMVTLVTSKLQQFGIQTDALSITNFNFSDQFNTAIEAKVTAEQNALAAQNKLQQVQFEAEQTVATAKAQAEAITIQTQAIQNGGGQAYVQLQAIEVEKAAVAKWDGTLPSQMIPGATLPFLNLTAQGK